MIFNLNFIQTQVFPAKRDKKVQVHTIIDHDNMIHTSILTIDISGRKAAVQSYVKDIESSANQSNDPHVLDRVISLLTQASAALKQRCSYMI